MLYYCLKYNYIYLYVIFKVLIFIQNHNIF